MDTGLRLGNATALQGQPGLLASHGRAMRLDPFAVTCRRFPEATEHQTGPVVDSDSLPDWRGYQLLERHRHAAGATKHIEKDKCALLTVVALEYAFETLEGAVRNPNMLSPSEHRLRQVVQSRLRVGAAH